MTTADATTIRIKDLVYLKNKFRFRGENEERVEKYRADIQRNKGKWPFPPILVATSFPADVTLDFDPKNKKETRKFCLVGGYRRVAAAEAEGIKEVPFTAEPMTTADQIIARGYIDNKDHGALPSKGDTYRAIKRLSENLTVTAIAELVGMDKSSVSRIIREKQGQVATGKKKRKKAEKRNGNGNGATPFTPEGWTKEFASLGALYRKHHDALVKYMENVELVAVLDSIFMPPRTEGTEASAATPPDAA